MAHGKLWKLWARRLGASPKATCSIHELGEGAKEHFKRKDNPKKYHIVYLNGTSLEVVSSCSRRLKNLANRMISNRPETNGNLWLIRVHDYERIQGDVSKAAKRIFR
jgi:hypothetical protein